MHPRSILEGTAGRRPGDGAEKGGGKWKTSRSGLVKGTEQGQVKLL